MSSMSRCDIFDPYVFGLRRDMETRFKVLATKDIRIWLSHIVNRVDNGIYRYFFCFFTKDFYINIEIDQKPFFRPSVNINPYVYTVFKYWVKMSDILTPFHVFRPTVDINGLSFTLRRVILTVITDSKRRHETHQFNHRLIFFTCDDTFQILVFHTVDKWILLLSFGNVNHMNFRIMWNNKTRAGLIPWVSIRRKSDVSCQLHLQILFMER